MACRSKIDAMTCADAAVVVYLPFELLVGSKRNAFLMGRPKMPKHAKGLGRI